MKRILSSLFFLLIVAASLSAGQTAAYAAASVPHVVSVDNVWLYSSSGDKLFLLPTTYYAEILSLDDNYYYVTFNGVNGRVSKSEVSTVGYHTKAQGTMCDMRVDEAYSEFPTINLKSRPDLSSLTVTELPTSTSFTFVGRYPIDDELWYAVKFDQYFGYIRASRTNNKDIVISEWTPEVLPEQKTDEPSSAVENTLQNIKNDGSTLKIVLIVGLIVPAVLVIFLIFRPKAGRQPPH